MRNATGLERGFAGIEEIRGSRNNDTITGDAGDWLTTLDIPSISIELTNHYNMEWQRNLDGMLALLELYRQNNE